MTRSLLVYGAGSVGNHFAHAGRALGWRVRVVDPDPAALTRMQRDIYPARYGAWDDAITLAAPDDAGAADLVVVGTPPDVHLDVAEAAFATTRPRALLVEKPLCPPDERSLARADALATRARGQGCRLLVGYDHRVARSTQRAIERLREGALGEVLALDVAFREHWAGIFAAHPWLAGPADTYLGYAARGGGASGEHSHALDLFRYLAEAAGKGQVRSLVALLDEVSDGDARYDRQCLLQLTTEGGLVGRVAQDVVTRPPVKRATVQGSEGQLALSFSATLDVLSYTDASGRRTEERFEKTRPDDFITELLHVDRLLDRPLEDEGAASPLDFAACRDSARVHLALHRSSALGRVVRLDEVGAP